MNRIAALWLTTSPLLIGVVADSSAAWAHRPYITLAEKILLPDGREGEILLLHGDGIITSDPVRVIVVDSDNRILAKSRRSQFMTLVCTSPLQCDAYDGKDATVLELDLNDRRPDTTFLPRNGADVDKDLLWDIEIDPQSWGFRSRSADWLDRLRGEVALASRPGAIFQAIVAILSGALIGWSALMLIGKLPDRRDRPRYFYRIGLKIVVPLVLLPCAVALMFMTLIITAPTKLFLFCAVLFGMIVSVSRPLLRWLLLRHPQESLQ